MDTHKQHTTQEHSLRKVEDGSMHKTYQGSAMSKADHSAHAGRPPLRNYSRMGINMS